MTFPVKYEAGHTYTETWVFTEYFCPNCGKKDVWMDDGGGDYYVGPQHICATCHADFQLPSGADPNDGSWQNRQRLERLAT